MCEEEGTHVREKCMSHASRREGRAGSPALLANKHTPAPSLPPTHVPDTCLAACKVPAVCLTPACCQLSKHLPPTWVVSFQAQAMAPASPTTLPAPVRPCPSALTLQAELVGASTVSGVALSMKAPSRPAQGAAQGTRSMLQHMYMYGP